MIICKKIQKNLLFFIKKGRFLGKLCFWVLCRFRPTSEEDFGKERIFLGKRPDIQERGTFWLQNKKRMKVVSFFPIKISAKFQPYHFPKIALKIPSWKARLFTFCIATTSFESEESWNLEFVVISFNFLGPEWYFLPFFLYF